MLYIFQRQPSKSFPVVQRLPKLTLPQPPTPATKVSLEPGYNGLYLLGKEELQHFPLHSNKATH